mmetsp:Transcript_1514/g.1721  ORF Transcript_1514/g.1721 Transcript_1514/m.1721 type:complete len:81 (-) Transcript_1514:716-958(-)
MRLNSEKAQAFGCPKTCSCIKENSGGAVLDVKELTVMLYLILEILKPVMVLEIDLKSPFHRTWLASSQKHGMSIYIYFRD